MRQRMLTTAVSVLGVSLLGCEAMDVQSLTNNTNSSSTNANIRVVHASPDAPAVDVCADGGVLFAGASFPAATPYESVPAATYDVSVIPAGAGCATMGVIEAMLPLTAGTDTTVVALNTLANIEPLVLSDDNSTVHGSARVRFVHASPDAPTVDITLVDGTTLFDNVSFGGFGGYITVPAGTYDLQVRDETGSVVVLNLPGVQLDSETVYTVFAIGFLTPGSGEPDLDAFITVDN